jgi:anti-sigma B factor antagonist
MAFAHQVRTDETRPDGSGVVVTLVGEIDLSNARSFEKDVQRLLAGRRPGMLTLDLAALTFMDSTAVSVVVRLWRMARRQGCTLRVVNPTGAVRHVLDVTGAITVVGAPVTPVTPEPTAQ